MCRLNRTWRARGIHVYHWNNLIKRYFKNTKPLVLGGIEASLRRIAHYDYWTDSIKPNGNFYITDESINYVFNPYEIAPYYMGQTEVTIPFSRIKDLLKPNSIIGYLVEKQAKQ